MISFFRAPIKNITPEAQVSILQIYKYITSGYAKLATDRLRLIADHYEARRYKSEMLDYVTFSGCFSSRRTGGLIEHSGFLCFDIDKIESEKRLQEIKSLLINDEELHTVLCFRSPSGNGLKWVVEVPDRYSLRSCRQSTDNITPFGRDFCSAQHSTSKLDSAFACRKKSTDNRPLTVDCRQSTIEVIVGNHRVLYERIRGYLFEQYGIETDHTSDIARPCYLCHDVDAYYDEPNFKDNPASRFLKSTNTPENLERFARLDNPEELALLVSTDNITPFGRVNGQQTTDNKLHKTDTNQQTVDRRPSTVDKNKNDYENDIEKIVREIEHRRIDITNDYHDWMLVAMALAGTCGATGEHYFHRISQFHPKYDNAEAHRMYQSCVRNTHGAVGIGTIVYLMRN